MIRFASRFMFGLIVAALPVAQTLAQAYPTKAVRLIVPGPPGSVTDVRARWVADKLMSVLGQSVVIDNRPGAGGNIATEAAAKSAPDGYTLLVVHQGTAAINPHIYDRPGYDALTDFAFVTRISSNPLLLAVHPDVPAHSVAELIKLAKAKPGQLNFGSPGNGTPPHMAGELFKFMAKIDVTHVPYKGGAPALTDLVAGRVAYSLESAAIQLAPVKAGKLRALGFTGSKRVAAMPDTPTIAESGLPGYEYIAWLGIAAPAATPKPIVAKLQADIATVLRTPAAKEWFAQHAADPGGESPEEFTAFIKAEYKKWGIVVREIGMKAD
jgi:tripartite-type tricarboxylate transporter receptor subunit TctC